MLKDFLEKCKIEKNLAEKLNNKEKTLYVIKGFGDYNFKSYGLKRLINVDLKLLNSVEEFDDKSFLTEIPLKFMEGKACVTSYEEFILFSNEIITLANIYDYKIEIFENDIFHVFYPLPSFVMEEQLVKNIESNKELNLSRIYDDYIYSSNGILISYQPFEKYETIISKSIFKACDLKIKEITEIKQVDPLIISLSDDDENFSIALMEIINHPKEKVYINFNKLNEPIYQLRTISILNSFGYKIFKIEKKIKKDDDVDYSEYEKILKRKNSNFSFRDIDFYKNPGFSLDTIKISQGNIVHALVQNAKIAKKEGKGYNDIFVTAPTGAGKSILFQIPAIYLAETEGLLTIVITPLIGLMNDQVQNIKSMTDKAATINSEYTPDEKNEIKKKIQKGEISILYVSPETLLSNNPIDNLIGNRKIGLLIIDEAHIVTTWGKSFRPDYWFLGDYISYLRNKQNQKFPIATFSATITYGGNDDMHGDVIDGLKMQTGQYEYIAPMRRDDIEFDIELHENVSDYLMEKEHAVLNSLNELNKNNIKTISYFPFTKQVNEYEKKMKSKKSAVIMVVW